MAPGRPPLGGEPARRFFGMRPRRGNQAFILTLHPHSLSLGGVPLERRVEGVLTPQRGRALVPEPEQGRPEDWFPWLELVRPGGSGPEPEREPPLGFAPGPEPKSVRGPEPEFGFHRPGL
jgi:hypothetical protein